MEKINITGVENILYKDTQLQNKINEIIDFINKIKDNPVPSIDKIYDKIIEEKDDLLNHMSAWDALRLFKDRLQNGVETDKKKPNK